MNGVLAGVLVALGTHLLLPAAVIPALTGIATAVAAALFVALFAALFANQE